MNVLYSFRTRGVGAESVHISGIANAMVSLGHNIDFESPTGVDPRQKAGSNPYRDRRKPSFLHSIARHLPGPFFEFAEIAYNLQSKRRIRNRLRQKDYGLIYERHAFFLHTTSRLAQQNRIPYVVEVNELVGDERVRKPPLLTSLCHKWDGQIFHRATRIVTVSPHLKRKIVEQHGVSEEKILVHPNAVDAALLEKNPDPEPFRQQFNLHGHLTIGFVGWFVEWHRLDLLLNTFSQLCRQQPGLRPRLLLVGDGPLKESLSQQARDLGIDQNLTFAGTLPHEDIPALLRSLDIAVIPHSNQYRSPIKLFEYMAQSRAVVAPSTEPIASVIQDGESGCLFPPLDQSKLTETLTQLATDPQLRHQLGQNARQTVETHHTWTHNVQDILDHLPNPSV